MFKKLLGLFAVANASISDCYGSNGLFKLQSYSIIPEVPVPGENVTLSLDYIVPKRIETGSAIYTMTINGFPFSQSQDLCEVTKCPIEVGEYSTVSNISFPAGLSGTLTAKIEWTSEIPLMCIKIKTEVGLPYLALPAPNTQLDIDDLFHVYDFYNTMERIAFKGEMTIWEPKAFNDEEEPVLFYGPLIEQENVVSMEDKFNITELIDLVERVSLRGSKKQLRK